MKIGIKSSNIYYIPLAIIVIVIFVLVLRHAGTAKEENVAALPIPRFVTLASDEVNMRVGPGVRYPIKLVFRKVGLPVEVIKEFDIWRQIKSRDGDTGWVHQNMLSGKRSVIITNDVQTIYKKPAYDSKPVVKLEKGVIAKLGKCVANWCEIQASGYKGWIAKMAIWGVYSNEVIEK